MRSWQIIVASAAAATIADALLFQPGGFPSRPELTALLLAHWPAIAVVWLGVYGVTALVLTTLAVFLDVVSVTPRRDWDDGVRRYFVQLAVTQYFTSVLALLGFGLSDVPVETAPFLFLPSPVGGSPAFAACGVLAVVGLLGVIFMTAALVTGESPDLRSHLPGIRAGRLFHDVSEPMAAPTTAPVDAAADALPPLPAQVPANAAVDVAEIAELIEREQRPVVEVVRDLAIAVNRLRRDLRQGIVEIKVGFQDRESGQTSEAGSASLSAIAHAATELHAAATAVDASVARLGEIASLLLAKETPAVADRDAPISHGARSQISTELQALLRDMTPVAGRGDPPG